ncbi:sensor histidine kinase [Desulfobacter latus]|uniref:histidine kinase n=1 Tax=Desulfobacter latus TaxID=2292 RepID=A0A850SWB6_9BACT|nr:ATP-binding protein [Desulfobacter latus]NWH05624.1 HAMP domain-containing protein [Desulfobacter latus]
MHRKKTKLIWRIFPSFLIIILLSLTVEAWYSISYFKGFFLENTQRELMVRASLMQDRFARALYVDGLSPQQIDALCKDLGKKVQTRITVILHSGEVIGDSFARVETMENHRKRPEIQKALSGEKSMALRYSPTLDKNMMYIALPIVYNRSDPAVIRTAVSISDIDTKAEAMRNSIALVLVLTTMAAALASLYVSRRIANPVEQMRRGAQAFSKGNLTNQLPFPDTEELSQLAKAMNSMAAELNKKIMDVRNRSRELEAVHTSMQEGVIAINDQDQIITINKAAAKIFDFSPEMLKTRHVLEVARNYDLQIFIKKALATSEPVEDDIVIDTGERMVLNIHSTALYDAHDKRMGTLIIFHDITRIRLLESMHKDFAANVSHELKTPLTTIKGFIETLQQMMADSQSALTQDSAVQFGRFLGIIEKNVNRMVRLIDDLLALSKLERLKGTDIQFEAHPLAGLIQKVVRFCTDRAQSRGITMDVHCPDTISAMVDPTLMEQAVFNLVDNAIKYSGEGVCISINAELKDDNIEIQIKDTGQGIDAAHLPKVFNRFYRVDKGRSRDQGGTGLGLAIVKHIVQYHNGRIEVESRRGKGTCFTITLPGAAEMETASG